MVRVFVARMRIVPLVRGESKLINSRQQSDPSYLDASVFSTRSIAIYARGLNRVDAEKKKPKGTEQVRCARQTVPLAGILRVVFISEAGHVRRDRS